MAYDLLRKNRYFIAHHRFSLQILLFEIGFDTHGLLFPACRAAGQIRQRRSPESIRFGFFLMPQRNVAGDDLIGAFGRFESTTIIKESPMTKCTMNSLRPVVLTLIVMAIALTPIAGQALASCGQTVQTTLIAGQSIPAGSVIIENDAQYLYVTYQTNGNWLITETHLDVATRPEDLKQTSKGNAVPGRFAYKSEHNPGVATVTHTVDLAAWPSDAQLFIAAHSVVVSASGSETAWGEGMDFPGNNWAMYVSYAVQSCDPPPMEPGVIDMLPSTVEVLENGVSITLQLIRTTGSDGLATVTLDTDGITATMGDDFETVTNMVTFGNGETEKFFEIYILDDAQEEIDEQFRVQISNVTGAEMGVNTSTICTIIDDDHAMPE